MAVLAVCKLGFHHPPDLFNRLQFGMVALLPQLGFDFYRNEAFYSTFSITPGKGQCAAARSRMREGRGGILFVADTRSRRSSQKETPSLRQVFLRLAKVSRQRRPRSLRVPPLTFRFLT